MPNPLDEHSENSEQRHTLHQPMQIISLTDGVFAILMTL